MKDTLTHRELCKKAASYLRHKGITPFNRCNYVVCELERIGESPDAFGFGHGGTQLIEVKISRADFLSDKNKYWRKEPQSGLGDFRSYLCPKGIILETDLPENWGLLWINSIGEITEIKKPDHQISNKRAEIALISSILRREGIKPQVFNYKKYKSEIK